MKLQALIHFLPLVNFGIFKIKIIFVILIFKIKTIKNNLEIKERKGFKAMKICLGNFKIYLQEVAIHSVLKI